MQVGGPSEEAALVAGPDGAEDDLRPDGGSAARPGESSAAAGGGVPAGGAEGEVRSVWRYSDCLQMCFCHVLRLYLLI